MAFWQMSALSSRVGGDIDGGVGNDQGLVVSGNIHEKDVTDAAAGAQARVASDDGAKQFVTMQAAFHQQFRFAASNELHRFGSRCPAVRSFNDFDAVEVHAGGRGDFGDEVCRGPTRIGLIRPISLASKAPASDDLSQGCATAVGTGASPAHRSKMRSYFPVPVFAADFMLPPRSPRGCAPPGRFPSAGRRSARRPGRLRIKGVERSFGTARVRFPYLPRIVAGAIRRRDP